jgi:hypothetical protein
VLVERETIDKNELEALLDDKWDEYLANEEPKDDADSSGSQAEKPAAEEAKEPAPADPPMAPGTPPAYNA